MASNHLPTYPPFVQQQQQLHMQQQFPHQYDAYQPSNDALYYNSSLPESQHPSYLSSERPLPYPMLSKSSIRSEGTDRTAAEGDSNVVLSSSLPTPEKEPGFFRSVLPSSMACRLYLLSVLLETIVDLAIEADILVLLNRNIPSSSDGEDNLSVSRLPVYLVVFALAHLFQLILAIDAVHARNTLQFIFLTIFNGLLLMYSVIQKSEILSAVPSTTTGITDISVNALTTIIPVVIGVAEVAYIALGLKIYREFGWQVYKLLGADRSVKRMYMHFQIFICLTKFDVFFWIGFSVQWIFLVLKSNDAEYYITVAALPLSLLLLIEGHMAARYESKWLMISFMSGCVAACCYFVYKLYKILRFKDDLDLKPVFKTLTVFSSIATVLLVVTFAWGWIVMRNFGAGLKFHMTKHKKGGSSVSLGRSGTQLRHHRASHYELGGNNPNRMSID